MSSSKRLFAGLLFAGRQFAVSLFRGVGIEVEVGGPGGGDSSVPLYLTEPKAKKKKKKAAPEPEAIKPAEPAPRTLTHKGRFWLPTCRLQVGEIKSSLPPTFTHAGHVRFRVPVATIRAGRFIRNDDEEVFRLLGIR